MKASIIIASWNRKKDTLETLESLVKSTIRDFQLEIVVVDNGSTDGSVEALEKYSHKFMSSAEETLGEKRGGAEQICDNSHKPIFKLIKNQTNLGFAEGNNIGIRYVLKNDSDYIILLNDDTIVDKNLVLQLINGAIRNKDAGILSPKIYFAKGFEFHKERYKRQDLGKVIWSAGGDIDWNNIYATNHGVDEVDRGQFDKVREIDFATGCCALIKKELIKKAGLFDAKYFAYFEDADLAQRVKKAGWKVLFFPEAYLWHKVSQSSGIGSDLNDYFITRNRMLFGMRYASLRTKFALIRESFRLLFNGRKWQKIGIKDFYLCKFGRGSWPKG